MSDALSRINLSGLSGIGSGKRKRVPPRDKSLFTEPEAQVEQQAAPTTHEVTTVEVNPQPEAAKPLPKASPDPPPDLPPNLPSDLLPDSPPDLPIVKATMFRVEEDLYDALTQWCQQNRITRETFLEAAILQAQTDRELQAKLIQIAANRCSRRKEAKERRKAMTLAAKYLG